MNKFSVETKTDGIWRLEKDFSTLSGAVRFSKKRLLSREYRILDRTTGDIQRYSDGDPNVPPDLDPELLADLQQEVQRFENTDRWRNRFQQQREERERRDEERRARISRFNFVGNAPNIPVRRPPQSNRFYDVDNDIMAVYGVQTRAKEEYEKVDWLKEGF